MALRPKIKHENGTLSDLPIAAETAVKLKTSRNIGLSGVTATSRSFDGTSAITIPITAVPGSLLTGSTSINTTGNAATATMLSQSWTTFTPGSTVLPFGTYLIKVDVSDNSSGIGSHGATITDIITMLDDSNSVFFNYSYDHPGGAIHTYVANNYEAPWYRTARIKIVSNTTLGFRVNFFLSSSGGYAFSSTNISGTNFYPDRVASTISGVTYIMKYKRIM